MKVLKPNGLRPQESIKRSLVKSLIYRVLMVLSDFFILYIVSGRLDISASFAVINIFWNTFAYFMYDRVWNQVKWGQSIEEYAPGEEQPHFQLKLPHIAHKEKPNDTIDNN